MLRETQRVRFEGGRVLRGDREMIHLQPPHKNGDHVQKGAQGSLTCHPPLCWALRGCARVNADGKAELSGGRACHLERPLCLKGPEKCLLLLGWGWGCAQNRDPARRQETTFSLKLLPWGGEEGGLSRRSSHWTGINYKYILFSLFKKNNRG